MESVVKWEYWWCYEMGVLVVLYEERCDDARVNMSDAGVNK